MKSRKKCIIEEFVDKVTGTQSTAICRYDCDVMLQNQHRNEIKRKFAGTLQAKNSRELNQRSYRIGQRFNRFRENPKESRDCRLSTERETTVIAPAVHYNNAVNKSNANAEENKLNALRCVELRNEVNALKERCRELEMEKSVFERVHTMTNRIDNHRRSRNVSHHSEVEAKRLSAPSSSTASSRTVVPCSCTVNGNNMLKEEIWRQFQRDSIADIQRLNVVKDADLSEMSEREMLRHDLETNKHFTLEVSYKANPPRKTMDKMKHRSDRTSQQIESGFQNDYHHQHERVNLNLNALPNEYIVQAQKAEVQQLHVERMIRKQYGTTETCQPAHQALKRESTFTEMHGHDSKHQKNQKVYSLTEVVGKDHVARHLEIDESKHDGGQGLTKEFGNQLVEAQESLRIEILQLKKKCEQGLTKEYGDLLIEGQEALRVEVLQLKKKCEQLDRDKQDKPLPPPFATQAKRQAENPPEISSQSQGQEPQLKASEPVANTQESEQKKRSEVSIPETQLSQNDKRDKDGTITNMQQHQMLVKQRDELMKSIRRDRESLGRNSIYHQKNVSMKVVASTPTEHVVSEIAEIETDLDSIRSQDVVRNKEESKE